MTWNVLLEAELARELGWALLHFVWQGSLAAACLLSLNVLLRRRSPQLRYAAASATLLVMLGLPVASVVVALRAPVVGVERAGAWELPAIAALPGATAAGAAAEAPAASLEQRLAGWIPVVLVAWCLGVAALSLRFVGGWALAQRIKRSGLPPRIAEWQRSADRLRRALRVSRPVRLCESALVEVPTVIGWLRPVILLPVSTLAGLSPAQLEVILAHELAHIRRFDYVANLLQSLVETLLFYHPAVWWVSHRMRVEREHCCDDEAVAACGDAPGYARALLDLAALRVEPRLAVAAAGGSLFQRISRLVSGPPQHVSRSSRLFASVVALGSLAAIGVGAGAPLRASFDDDSRSGVAQPTTFERAGLRSAARIDPAAVMEQEAEQAEPEVEEAEPASQVDPAATWQADPETAPEEVRSPAQDRDEPLPVARLIELANAGVTPAYADEMAAAGYLSLSWDELLELRNHGVSGEFVSGMRELGLDRPSVTDLVALRSHGVSPEFARELKAAGYDEISVSRLVTLRSQGVSARYVAELRELGYDKLTLARLIGLRSQGVGPEYIRELKALGYSSLSVPILIALRSHGVSTSYVKELKDAGYSGLEPGVLIDLRSHGVTPEFVRELKQAGYESVAPADLIALRSNGVSPELLQRVRSRR
jgi:beta-lactamase regulating signal transducer with metallopeptidase domain